MKLRQFGFGLLLTLAAVLLALGVFRLKFNTQLASLFPDSIKEARGLGLFLEHFAHEGELIVVLDQGTQSELIAASETVEKALKAETKLVRNVIARSPWEEKPEEMVDFFAFSLLNLPPEQLEALQDRVSPDKIKATLEKSLEDLQTSLTMQENLAGYDPLGLAAMVMQERSRGFGSFDGFSTQDGKMRLLIVESTEPKVHYRVKLEWLNQIRAVINKALEQGGKGGIRARLTGEPAFMAEIANGMESDMQGSAISTLVLSALLIWLTYASLRPLIIINGAMFLIILLTMGACGWLLGELTVFTAGFASILVGLVIDYGVLIYEDSRTLGQGREVLRKHCMRTILAAAGTTSAAFFALRASSLPGLQELGTILGLGVLIGAVVMLLLLPKWLGDRPVHRRGIIQWEGHPRFFKVMPGLVILFTVVALVGLVVRGFPGLSTSVEPLRPRDCEAQATMNAMLESMSGSRNAKSILIVGNSEEEVGREIQAATALIEEAEKAGGVNAFALPGPVWPEATKQKRNLQGPAGSLVADAARLKQAVLDAGYEEAAFVLTQGVIDYWKRWAAKDSYPLWPESHGSQWTVSRYYHADKGQVFCMGVLQTNNNAVGDALVETLRVRENLYLLSDGAILSALGRQLPTETLRIFIVLSLGMLIMLIWTFRAVREVLLCIGCSVLNVVVLLGVMAWMRWEWNFINLAGLLLCVGTGVDYSIHVLLRMRANGGDIAEMQRTTGRGLMLCAASTVIGFGSLAWAGNKGLASMGLVCSAAILCSFLLNLFLLPYLAPKTATKAEV